MPTTPPPMMATRPRADARDAEQQALAAVVFLQTSRTDLHGHAACELRSSV
jgi:hypothetical protein